MEIPTGAVGGAIKVLRSILTGVKEGKRAFLKLHIEELHKYVMTSHEDYLNGFRKVRIAIDNDIAPKDVISFLKDIKAAGQAQRQLAKQYADLLIENTSSLPYGIGPDDISGYCSAVSEYYNYGTRIGNSSWYSDYIRFVEVSVKSLKNDHWNDDVFGNDAKEDLLKVIDRNLDGGLQRALNLVIAEYLKLRLLLA